MSRDNLYPVTLLPPDIFPYKSGNTGVDYVWTFTAPRSGPHAMITAVVHGNELCGALVLDELLKSGFRPRVGCLTLAFVNVLAYQRFDHRHPLTSRYVDEDFNRLWSESELLSESISAERNRVKELRATIDTVDYLLDLHSMQHPTEAIGLCGPTEKGREFARTLGYPRVIVSDVGHAAGKRMRDYGDFTNPKSHKNALLVECGQHWEPASVEVARTSAKKFLNAMNMLEVEATMERQSSPPSEQIFIEITEPITVCGNHFEFIENYVGMEVIDHAGTVIGYDGERPIKTPYDQCVLIMPSRRLTRGNTAVRLGRFSQ